MSWRVYISPLTTVNLIFSANTNSQPVFRWHERGWSVFVESDYDGLAAAAGTDAERCVKKERAGSGPWAEPEWNSMDINIWADLSSLRPAGSVCRPASVGVETAGWMERGSGGAERLGCSRSKGRTEDDRESGKSQTGNHHHLGLDPLSHWGSADNHTGYRLIGGSQFWAGRAELWSNYFIYTICERSGKLPSTFQSVFFRLFTISDQQSKSNWKVLFTME